MKIVWLALSLIALSGPAAAITAEDLLNLKNSEKQEERRYSMLYMAGLTDGIMIMQARNKDLRQARNICPPPKLALSGQMYFAQLTNFLADHPSMKTTEASAAIVLMLEEAFPCDKKPPA